MDSNVQVRSSEDETDILSKKSFPDCPACYREVQKRVNRYRDDLRVLHDAIFTLNSSQTLHTLREDKQLTGELDALAKNLNNLKFDLQSQTDEKRSSVAI